MRRPLRAVALVFLLAPSFGAAAFLAVTRRMAPAVHRRAQPFLMRNWFRVLARVLGLRVRASGEPLSGPVLMACNHLSWLDIVALGAILDTAFISKGEIDRWPMLGYFARHGGRTLFITRGELRSFQALGGSLITRLRNGERILFFPEGTVSAGRGLLRFKPRLFEAARAAGCPVQPVALAYAGGDGASLAPMSDGQSFVGNLVRVLVARRTEVVISFLPPINETGDSARELAVQTREIVAAALLGPLSAAE